MLKIEIASNEVININGTSNKTGKPYSIRKQSAYLFMPGEKYPVPFEFNLETNQAAYEPGFYEVMSSSFYIDRFKSLSVGRLDLTRITKQEKAA